METHIDSWEIEFDKVFGDKYDAYVLPSTKDKIKDFIRSHFIEKGELRKKIKSLKKDDKINPDTGMPYYSDFWKGNVKGFNQCLEDIKEIIK